MKLFTLTLITLLALSPISSMARYDSNTDQIMLGSIAAVIIAPFAVCTLAGLALVLEDAVRELRQTSPETLIKVGLGIAGLYAIAKIGEKTFDYISKKIDEKSADNNPIENSIDQISTKESEGLEEERASKVL